MGIEGADALGAVGGHADFRAREQTVKNGAVGELEALTDFRVSVPAGFTVSTVP